MSVNLLTRAGIIGVAPCQQHKLWSTEKLAYNIMDYLKAPDRVSEIYIKHLALIVGHNWMYVLCTIIELNIFSANSYETFGILVKPKNFTSHLMENLKLCKKIFFAETPLILLRVR